MPRQAKLDTPGALHHVMLRGIEKRVIITDDQGREDFVARMGSAGRATGAAICAWVCATGNIGNRKL